MKLVLVLVLFSLNAHAFGISLPSSGTQAESVTKKVVGKSLEAGINDSLKKKNCKFKNGSTETETTCDLNAIVNDLKSWRNGLEASIANDVDINIEASATTSDLAWKRVSAVQDVLKAKISWWDWYTHKTTANGDGLRIWVKVQ